MKRISNAAFIALRNGAFILLTLFLTSACSKVGETGFNLGGNGTGYGKQDGGNPGNGGSGTNGSPIQVSTTVNTPKTFAVVQGASTINLNAPPSHGNLTVSFGNPDPNVGSSGITITYTPNNDFVGSDAFGYQATVDNQNMSVAYHIDVTGNPNNGSATPPNTPK